MSLFALTDNDTDMFITTEVLKESYPKMVNTAVCVAYSTLYGSNSVAAFKQKKRSQVRFYTCKISSSAWMVEVHLKNLEKRQVSEEPLTNPLITIKA